MLLLCSAVADLELNGVLVGRTANAHRPHAFEVAPLLLPPSPGGGAGNQLSVTLLSATLYSEQQAAAYPYAVPHTQQLGNIGGAYNFVRKAASDFGWDWGPAFAPAAISGAVELRGRSSASLSGKHLHVQAGSQVCACLRCTKSAIVAVLFVTLPQASSHASSISTMAACCCW